MATGCFCYRRRAQLKSNERQNIKPSRFPAFYLLVSSQRWHWVEALLLTVSTALLFGMSWFLNVSVWVTNLHWEWFGVSQSVSQRRLVESGFILSATTVSISRYLVSGPRTQKFPNHGTYKTKARKTPKPSRETLGLTSPQAKEHKAPSTAVMTRFPPTRPSWCSRPSGARAAFPYLS